MKKLIKTHLWVLGILFSISLILFFALPTLLSTKKGTAYLLKDLEKRFGGNYEIDQLQFSWFGTQRAVGIKVHKDEKHLMADEFTLNMSLLKFLKMRNYTLELIYSGDLRIKNASFFLSSGSSITNLNLDGDSRTHTIHLTAKTKIDNEEDGYIEVTGKQGDSLEWHGHVERLPIGYVEFMHPGYPFIAIIGNWANIILDCVDNRLNLSFNSPNLQFKTCGKLEDGVYFLLEPMTVYYTLNEASSDEIFKKCSVKPVSSELIVGKIEPRNTYFSYYPFSVDAISISSMNWNLGKMIFRNFGTFSDILSVVKLEVRKNKDVPIWFQDLPLSVERGVMTAKRTEMLIDNTYELGFMGKVDFNTETVDGNLILTAQVLRKVFHLKKIPSTYTVMMKTDGPYSDIKIHKSMALREIGRVVITEKANLPILPMPVVNPPPARQPVPWGNLQ